MQAANCRTQNARRRVSRAERVRRIVRLLLTALACSVTPAFSQPRAAQPRVFVSANAVYRTTTRTLSDSITFSTPFSAGRELGTANSTYKVPTGVMFDGGGTVRLWRGLGAGVAVSTFSNPNDFNITAQLPHPFFFNEMRQVEGTGNSRHTETAVHVMAAYYVPLTRRASVMLSAGPTWFSLEQKLVSSVTAIELYPFDTAQFGAADLQTFNTSAWGFNAGADISWLFTRNFGLGGLVRFAQATAKMNPADRATVNMDVGGFHVGGGARILF